MLCQTPFLFLLLCRWHIHIRPLLSGQYRCGSGSIGWCHWGRSQWVVSDKPFLFFGLIYPKVSWLLMTLFQPAWTVIVLIGIHWIWRRLSAKWAAIRVNRPGYWLSHFVVASVILLAHKGLYLTT